MAKYKAGVLFGDELNALLDDAKQNKFALPAVNVFNTNSINASLETAALVNSPIFIQFSISSAQFIAGKAIPNHNMKGSILGAISGAMHVHTVSRHYGVPVVLHTDHASREWLPWIDGLIREGETYKAKHDGPLFSSHMLDLSKETLAENIKLSKQYFQRVAKLSMGLEMELGVTGGEEEGVNNFNVAKENLYTQPADVAAAYDALGQIGKNFTIAASFGNVHGVYNPDNVELRPDILKESQAYIKEKYSTSDNPVKFVFHGGSGSSKEQLKQSIDYGVVKMNIDTDLHWAFWDGVRTYHEEHHKYLRSQLGNPQGMDKPNKKYYDAKTWLRKAEEGMIERLKGAFEDLNCINRNL